MEKQCTFHCTVIPGFNVAADLDNVLSHLCWYNNSIILMSCYRYPNHTSPKSRTVVGEEVSTDLVV